PLLHLWSLGIEEQYYIAWPPLLWFAWKRNVNILAIAMALFVSSFALNMSIIQSDAVAAFYSPLTRVWELMVGSILACVLLRAREGLSEGRAGTKAWSSWMSDAFNAQQASKAWCNTQSFVGCALIGVGIVTITTDQPFPGTWALLPTAGSALVIVAGAHAWMNRVVLSNRVLVWFGLISFPLYLWHWPLLSFARIVEGATPAREIRIAAVLLSIVLAWATYRFVEWPIRRSDEQLGKKAFRLAALMLVVGCAGYGVPRLDAFSWRAAAAPPITNEGDIAPRSVADYVETHFHACTSIEVRQERCFQSQESGPSTIAIVGDSHAEDLFVGMSAALSQQNVLLYVRDELPLAGTQAFKDWLNYVLTDEDIRTVILTAYWFGRISSVSVDRSLESELAQTVQLLTEAGKRVYVGDDVPQFSFYPEKCKYARRFSQNSCLEDREFFFQRRQDYLPLLEALERDNSEVRVLRMSEYFCDATNCSMARDGQVLYRDSHHLNVNGSMFLGPLIVEDNPALRD
ncbi:acyltransferase, partial [bacterium AH-315-O15]|nr:acyltransferase [bacterium AH-315-O15]